mmetsp:Transcript_15904/g.53519  ORF Transcript_15904/g.53519 Transcript_15904/m.53519 type:complete len:400 (-) Transcript_15904:429-1628(-)
MDGHGGRPHPRALPPAQHADARVGRARRVGASRRQPGAAWLRSALCRAVKLLCSYRRGQERPASRRPRRGQDARSRRPAGAKTVGLGGGVREDGPGGGARPDHRADQRPRPADPRPRSRSRPPLHPRLGRDGRPLVAHAVREAGGRPRPARRHDGPGVRAPAPARAYGALLRRAELARGRRRRGVLPLPGARSFLAGARDAGPVARLAQRAAAGAPAGLVGQPPRRARGRLLKGDAYFGAARRRRGADPQRPRRKPGRLDQQGAPPDSRRRRGDAGRLLVRRGERHLHLRREAVGAARRARPLEARPRFVQHRRLVRAPRARPAVPARGEGRRGSPDCAPLPRLADTKGARRGAQGVPQAGAQLVGDCRRRADRRGAGARPPRHGPVCAWPRPEQRRAC